MSAWRRGSRTASQNEKGLEPGVAESPIPHSAWRLQHAMGNAAQAESETASGWSATRGWWTCGGNLLGAAT